MADSLCRLTPLPSQSGSWQVFMIETEDPNEEVNNMPPEPMGPGTLPTDQGGEPQEPEVIQIQLHKVNGSMGLSIVAAKVRGCQCARDERSSLGVWEFSHLFLPQSG